ncbi:protein EI24 homolog isoform X2 [Tripterygium wilfordii]|uniref:protein EI24 homolog isoform X2 n=1 Tax=Tripterygium wilfordii TaxID=458696 RepID=UPI0018F80930|nr:protein EI24 homolog isoform X2 [Tripterygium wilfordii]
MEATTSAMPVTDILRTKSMQASLLWLEGFREACCLHRVFILCRRSRNLSIRTGQCFLLNGFIFLGSIFVMKSIVLPTLWWILPEKCPVNDDQQICLFGNILKVYYFLRLGLVQLFYVCWFYPLYVLSFILSTMWYNDIAKYGFAAMDGSGLAAAKPSSQDNMFASPHTAKKERLFNLGSVMIGFGEQVYSILLLTTFFLEVYAIGFMPYIGKSLRFLLLSWMYKWNLSEVALDKRLDFFESNWAFFAGFGSPYAMPTLFFSPLVSSGMMGILFPLFVLTATSSGAENFISSKRRGPGGARLGRLPIFYAADTLSKRILYLLPLESREQLPDDKTL